MPDEVSRHLLGSPVIRKLSFTGSTVVGKHLAKLAADDMKRTTMELGGHGPVLVFGDADLDRALDTAVAGKYRNCGQVCVSPTRFIVEENVFEKFRDGFVERIIPLVPNVTPSKWQTATVSSERYSHIAALFRCIDCLPEAQPTADADHAVGVAVPLSDEGRQPSA